MEYYVSGKKKTSKKEMNTVNYSKANINIIEWKSGKESEREIDNRPVVYTS